MSLQIIARAKSTAHLWSGLNLFRGHEVWRIYRWFGFDTQRVFCVCGVEFTKPKPGSPTTAECIAAVNRVRGRSVSLATGKA